MRDPFEPSRALYFVVMAVHDGGVYRASGFDLFDLLAPVEPRPVLQDTISTNEAISPCFAGEYQAVARHSRIS